MHPHIHFFIVVLDIFSNHGFKDFVNSLNCLYSTNEKGISFMTINITNLLLATFRLYFQLGSSPPGWPILATISFIEVFASHTCKCLFMWLVPDSLLAANFSLQWMHLPSTSL